MEDTDFTVGHGFRCLLPDFRLFVELTAYGWEAMIYEEPVRKYREPIHKQFLDGSSNGKNECKLFVNTWRAAENSGPTQATHSGTSVGGVLVTSPLFKCEQETIAIFV
jgi:hypothetical protein